MPRENSLENKRVVIVGGSSGIGLAVAEEAASQGAKIVIASSNAERIQKAIQSIGGEARGQAVDVSDESAVESFFAKVGAFDHLVFTAGDSLHLHELGSTVHLAQRAISSFARFVPKEIVRRVVDNSISTTLGRSWRPLGAPSADCRKVARRPAKSKMIS